MYVLNVLLAKFGLKNLGYNEGEEAVMLGERIIIDISSIKQVSYGGAKFWLLVQDEYSDYLWSFFLSTKSEQTEVLFNWIASYQKQYDMTIKTIGCDNSGENLKLKKELSNSQYNIKFEFTAPYTPQQNGKIERKFATLWGKVRSTMNSAQLPWTLCNKLWDQCAKLITQLQNILISKEHGDSPYKMMHDKEPEWLNNLHKFGELAIVHDGANANIRAKLQDGGLAAIFVGYPDNHAGEVCQF
jgi:transposase InsO family protein